MARRRVTRQFACAQVRWQWWRTFNFLLMLALAATAPTCIKTAQKTPLKRLQTFNATPGELFAMVVSVVQALGYAPEISDREQGIITTQWVHQEDDHLQLRIRLHATIHAVSAAQTALMLHAQIEQRNRSGQYEVLASSGAIEESTMHQIRERLAITD